MHTFLTIIIWLAILGLAFTCLSYILSILIYVFGFIIMIPIGTFNLVKGLFTKKKKDIDL